MKILITGSNGFLASNFIRMYNKNFKKIIGISKSKKKYLHKNYKHYSFDINDLIQFKKILKKEKPNILLLAASNSIVGESEINPIETLRTNTFSQAEIYEIIRKLDEYLGKYGDVVISGGDGLNINLSSVDRLISPDIDVKVIIKHPSVKERGWLNLYKHVVN